jgi:ubiquinone/menaquinone biosynthesis C-methylase UbiE
MIGNTKPEKSKEYGMENLQRFLNKLESPERLRELNPEETLKKIGLGENDVVLDIGAGSGIFTIAAAGITKETVYALDVNEALLEIIEDKAKKQNLPNVRTMKVAGRGYDITAGSADLAIMVTVLHELEDKAAVLAEVKRVMKSTAKLAIIEFYKEAAMGPPAALRLGPEEVAAMCGEVGLRPIKEFSLGDNCYCAVFGA